MKFGALFPGQGSQSVGMGHEFYQRSPVAKEIFAEADRALRIPLSKYCFEGPLETLTLTAHAQPALLTVSYIAFRLFGKKPAVAAGHSLGEYSALVAAECLSFEDAVSLVHKRGRYMQEAVPQGTGKMVAVIGGDVSQIVATIEELQTGVAEIANLNCPGQTVVAGDNAGIEAFSQAIGAKGLKTIPLNVSAPFHCRLMKPAAEQLARDLAATTFEHPQFPVISNVTAQVIGSGDAARKLLEEQVCSSVRWTESMEEMVRRYGISHAVEFGPGKVLSKLFKRIDKSVTTVDVADGASLAETTKLLAS